MASTVGKVCNGNTSQSSSVSVQEKGSRNKRKFRADPPVADASKIISSQLNDCSSYEFSAEKFDINRNNGCADCFDLCTACQEHSEALKLDLELSCAVGGNEAGPSTKLKEVMIPTEEFGDADWDDVTESQLEELVLCNLDAIFRSAIKKIVAAGYSEEVATKSVLRSGLCYGFKDTVSNIVDNTLGFLKNGQDVDSSTDHCFDDLQQMEKYILAELVCVLREVRPFFSTGDAMWCLLLCDMNVSLACSMDSDTFNNLGNEAEPNATPSDTHSSENVANPSKPIPSSRNSQSEIPIIASTTNPKSKGTFVINGIVKEKDGQNSSSEKVNKSSSVGTSSQSHESEERFIGTRKVAITKREYILRQKSIRLEKSYRTYGSKGSRNGKLSTFGGLMLDKKMKSVSESGISVKNTTIKISTIRSHNNSPNNASPKKTQSPPVFSLETVNSSISTSPKDDTDPNSPPGLSVAETELSLSTPGKTPIAPVPVSSKPGPGQPSLSQWVPQGKKDEEFRNAFARHRMLQSRLQEWNDWANQKVMQAARRLSKDKAELKALRQEKEEGERLKREKQVLEENTMKKLTEMENALRKASGQVERANSSVRKLEVENVGLRQQMEGAKLRAAESAASCQEVGKREKTTQAKFQSWEKQKGFLQEELAAEKRNSGKLKQELEIAKDQYNQIEANWKQEEKATEDLLAQAKALKTEREKIEASAKSKEESARAKNEKNLQTYKDNIQKLEKELSQLRLKTDSSKIAALKRGIDGSNAKATDPKTGPSPTDSQNLYISNMMKENSGGVKRELECVMCLSEEMSVLFLPCAHKVVCSSCNELHEKQGLKDCPSCRSPIQQRIFVRYAPQSIII